MANYVDEVVIPYDRDFGLALSEHMVPIPQDVSELVPMSLLEVVAGTSIVMRHFH